MKLINNKLLIVLSIISVLISIVYCKNQYVYTFDNEYSNFKVIDIENNKELINQVLPEGDLNIAIQYVYKETTNNQPGSKFPILSLFAEKTTIDYNLIYFTIDYNIDSNIFLNNGTQVPYTLKYDFYVEYESTPYSFVNSNLYLPVQFANGPDNNNSLIIFNWDLEKEIFKVLNYTENNSNQPSYGAMNQTSSLYYVLVFDDKLESQIQAIDYSNGESNGEKVGLFKFNATVLNFNELSDIHVTNNGILIAIKLVATDTSTQLSICAIDLQLLSCKEVFSFEANSLSNNFNLYNFDSTGEYMIISNSGANNTEIIEYYYVNLSTFKIDFAYKTSNYFDSKPNYYYY